MIIGGFCILREEITIEVNIREGLFNTVAIEVPGGNRIRRINIKAQHSAFSRAINRTVSYGLYMFIKSDVSS